MPQPFTIILGKAVRYAARLRGGGSALPGLFVEKISPTFVSDTLAQLPRGVVVISGTNGKTTTTKMVVSLLESQGLTVFTNRTGSNFVRGVAAALLGDIDVKGNLNADIAVLELDEAHAVKFVETVQPRYSLFLNVMRDQLDRFGEIDATARLLAKVAEATTDTIVLNREDRRIATLAEKLPKETTVRYFGLNDSLLHQFPSDDELHADAKKPSQKTPPARAAADVILKDFNEKGAAFTVAGKDFVTPLKLKGVYNIFNSAAALALARAIVPEASINSLLGALSTVTPAFGRGEVLNVGGHPLELVLVKNPAGFRLGLESYDPDGYATMIAINDNYADGRDMSWLWDVDFTSLTDFGAYLSGIRAYDMALRLQYDEVPIEKVDPDLTKALRDFIDLHSAAPKRIYCTYTAMLALRKELSKITRVEVVA
ncbi:MAG TPA: MurT ligase domain-containing protein [Dongiaceae bacterium]|nr:MurT ligase domain-containing protein [Dongiaceae bacterium]